MADKPSSPHLFADVLARVHAICAALATEGNWPDGIDFSRVVVEPPRDASHGDMATNAAMVLAKEAKTKPRDLAEKIAEKLRADALVASVDVAGPGFINLTLKPQVWADALRTVVREGEAYGRSAIGKAEKVNVEYVSANPTGPMHVGHCRGAVFGDALCSLLQFAGYDVTREYYINDAGAQVDVLGRSAYLRYLEALGEDIGDIPEGLYPGDYLVPVGQALAAEYGDKLKAMSENAWLPIVRSKAIAMMMEMIKGDLAALHIKHDVFFSERSLIDTGNNKVTETIDFLRGKGDVYEGRLPPPKGGPVEDYEDREQTLFRATNYGDDVGSDAVRFMMLFRKNDAVLDFDLAKVIEQSKDNAVFYVQYGHARGHSIFKNAREVVPDLPEDGADRATYLGTAAVERLTDPAELSLLKLLALYPRMVEAAAVAHEPHRIAFYLYDLASQFHALWIRGRDLPYLRFIINNDAEITEGRLAMVQGAVSG